MNFLLFNLFSVIENIAALMLMLAIFKYRVFDYIPQILLTSTVLSFISHSMRFDLDFGSWVPVVMIIIMFLFIWITFRVAILYSLIILVIGFAAYSLLQAILLFSFEFLGLLSQAGVESPYSLQGYTLQLVTSVIAFLISYQLRRNNYGFNWIPYGRSAKFKLKGQNITFLLAIITSVVIIGLVFHLYFTGSVHLLLITALFLLMMIYLIYLAGKQEKNYYD